MILEIAASATLGAFTLYPGYADHSSGGRIEAFTDRGTIYELIVKCPSGTGIMSFAKSDRMYCVPDGSCTRSLPAAIARTCG
ncbi:MAG: hypothetical protein AAFY64_00395 [Pseudomonadota bacterium]